MQILQKPQIKGYRKALKLGSLGVITFIKQKGLKGCGGANFQTGLKWEFVNNNAEKTRYVICNADEGEPGTFKDKFILINNPEAVIEGIMIAAYAVSAEQAYIYLRGEYEYLKSRVQKVINDVLKKTRSSLKIDIVVGAGAYICGEETAIMESIEGKRGHVREKPPYPTQIGLFGKPTVVNNVETLARAALCLACDDFNINLRLFSLSGNVSKPGVYELPSDVVLSDLIKLGEPKNKIKAVYFGCFGGCLPYSKIKLTPDNVCSLGAMLGACTVIAVDETHSIVDVATNISKFYEFESCGKCTPCREGTMRLMNFLTNISMGRAKRIDLETMQELAEVMRETSSCGLGQTASQHIITALKYFRKEFEEKVR